MEPVVVQTRIDRDQIRSELSIFGLRVIVSYRNCDYEWVYKVLINPIQNHVIISYAQ
jgi:hypothetical protein